MEEKKKIREKKIWEKKDVIQDDGRKQKIRIVNRKLETNVRNITRRKNRERTGWKMIIPGGK